MFLPMAIEIPLDEEGEQMMLGDGGDQMDEIFSQLSAESILVDLLSKLSDREKIFLLYQVLSVFGYSISQERFANTLSISRVNYINKLSALKAKLRVYLCTNKQHVSTL